MLEAEITAIQAEGEVFMNARIDSSKPGGSTVRGHPSTQYRLRVKGQKARYLKGTELEEIRAAIARGKRLKRLEREKLLTQRQLDRLVAKATELGIKLPE